MEFTCPVHGAPGYVNLNYRGTVDSALALAHELGHAVHATLAAEAQPPVYGGFDRFLAEIPSNVCEALLADHLLETAGSGSTRRAVLGRYLSRFRTMLVDMTVLAAFERRVHGHVEEGGSPTADWLDEQYADLLGRFYGREGLDDGIASRWMRMPLLFREEDWPFYAYGYATGMAVGLDVARRIRADGGETGRRYVELLERGSRGRPVDLVRSLGVDPADPATFERAFEVYERYLDVIA
jgi:oligoendopeptidase F